MNNIKTIPLIRWVGLGYFIITLVMNYISQAIPINSQTTGEVSAKYSTFLTPADFAFSIWILIYTILAGYIIYQMLWASTANKLYDKITTWLTISFIFTSAWLPAFQYELLGFSTLLLLFAFLSLFKCFTVLAEDQSLIYKKYLWLNIPVGVYFGWITVALMVNITVYWKYGLGMKEMPFILVLIAVLFIGAIIISKIYRNGFYLLPVAWGFFGIGMKENQFYLISTISYSIAVIIILAALLILYRNYSASIRKR